MNSGSHTVTKSEEIGQVNVSRPHIVILGAGASRATCLSGDANGKQLPVMEDLVEVVGLQDLLERAVRLPQFSGHQRIVV